jgi:hypothetical protein
MKKIIIGSFVLLSASFCHAQSTAAAMPATTVVAKPDVLQLKETAHNFGKIAQGRPVTYNFEIVNTGTEPLVLESVRASCGCTTPEWSKEPIIGGATSTIKVGYNAYAEGAFTKTVTITYNGNQIKILTITGEVFKSPSTSAPENSSVQLLKQTNQ